MDIFVEQLVKKKKEPKDFLIILAGVVCVFVVLFVLTFALAIPGIGFAIFAACVISMYLIYFLITSINQEFEYCFTNGMLDVDKIINMRKRKRVQEINVRKMEMLGNREDRSFRKHMEDSGLKKIYACTHKDAKDLCFLIFLDEEGTRKMLLFNPNDKIIDGIKKYNPQKVFLNNENRD